MTISYPTMHIKPMRFANALGAFLLLVAALGAKAAPAVGEVPPAQVGTAMNGDPVLLTNFTGKAVVVSFWASWCPYCLKELPILNNIQRVAGKERMQVIAVNTESREVFRETTRLLSKLDIQFTHDTDSDSSEAYGVKGLPYMVIIGRDGRVVALYRGYSESSLNAIVADINRALGAAQ